MTEDFLHYIWQNKLLKLPLKTTNGDLIQIISPGLHNHNAGPDFSNARLKIGNTLWAGNVEIHINSSDWFKHGHHEDETYQNVMLHVVYNDDCPAKFSSIPVCEIASNINIKLVDAYKKFINSKRFVPCINQLAGISQGDITLWLERILIEKLERKADFIQNALSRSTNDWEDALYNLVAKSFGFNINSLPFEMLARSLPFRVIARHADNPFQVEALIFGQAGLLSQETIDPFGQALFNEYVFLRKKYNLAPIDPSLWRFLRLRPVNFPTIRLSQFSNFICQNVGLMARTISMNSIDEIESLFNVSASHYWDDHYSFDKISRTQSKHLGVSAARLVIINAILPFMFVYGRSTSNDELCNKTLALYEQLPAESNSIITSWQTGGLKINTAFQSQALIELKTSYCNNRKCLSCRIGNLIFKNPAFTEECEFSLT